jgi:IS605 OrfB family transposase
MSNQPRTYVTTLTDIAAARFLGQFGQRGREAKIACLKLILDGKLSKSQINTELQHQHGINKRQANSIIAFMEGSVKSARACRSNHLEQLQGKLKHVSEVIQKLGQKIAAHRKYLRTQEAVNRGIKQRIPKTLKARYPDACPIRCAHHLTHYQFAQVKLHNKKRYAHKLTRQIEHLKNSPLPVNLGNSMSVEMIGSKDESYGNQICQLDFINKQLHIRVPYFLEEQYGKYITVKIDIPKHGTSELATAWFNHQAITYRFIRKSLFTWTVHITVDVHPTSIQSLDVSWGALGVDLNPGCIGWAKTDKDGNLQSCGQFKINIQSQPKGRTEAILAEAVTKLIKKALQYKCPIVVEQLNFSDKKKRMRELSTRHNRMLSNFAYSKFLQLLKARCFKLGIQLIEVNPAFSSVIGLVKFMSLYGLNSATAAAHVLARRAMNLSERIPANTAYQGKEPRKHVWSYWNSVSRRIKGSSRHSFYQPRLTACSRLRSVQVNPTVATRWGLGEVGENPTGSHRTAR